MCGIHGFTQTKNRQRCMQQMLDISNARGPDNRGIYNDDNIILGHNLLAITEDANISKQPWIIDDKYVLCYNGEIYNYLELKKDLQQFYKFKTESDTEILARGLQHYGIDFIYKLDGMYTFSWYDIQQKTLLLVRDPSGVKPLYYIFSKNKFIAFSSNIKSLFVLNIDGDRVLDMSAFYLYNKLGYVPGPKTLLRKINKLYPGQILQINLYNHTISTNITHHFNLDTTIEFNPSDYRNRMNQAVQQCLMGRRNIGLFLSGGLDSTAILHELCQYQNKPVTFTTRFDCSMKKTQVRNSDADIALKLSKDYKTDHHELLITLDNFLNSIEDTISILEEPRSNVNISAYYLMNKYIANNNITVTLSGDGGDELLTGYKHHAKIQECSKNDVLSKWYNLELMRYHSKCEKRNFIVNYINSWFPVDCLGSDTTNNHLYLESIMHLPEDYLIRNDKLGMSVSMEGRFPLTIPSFKKYVLSINSKYKKHRIIKIPSVKNKFDDLTVPFKLLPKLAYKNHLPNYVIDKVKTGWSIPKHEWFRDKKFINYFNCRIGSNFYKPTYKLRSKFRLDNEKHMIAFAFFQIWAKKFGIITDE